MNKENTKNVIILKELPSNLIDEAIIVVKDKKKIKDINGIVQGDMRTEDLKKIKNIKKEDRKYVIKEAEEVVKSYIKRIEDNFSDRKLDRLKKSYKKTRIINLFLALITIISISLAILV